MSKAPAHMDPPKEIQDHLAEYGGKNRFGEPMFRLVWGGSRMAWKGGRWDTLDPVTGLIAASERGYRQAPKYPVVDRFHVEVWRPPEFFGTPAEFAEASRQIFDGQAYDILGEYPSRGEYDSIDIVEQLGICECGIDLDMRDKLFRRYPKANDEIAPCETCGRNSSFIAPTRVYIEKVVDCWKESQTLAREKVEAFLKQQAEALEARHRKFYTDIFGELSPSMFLRPKVSFAGLNVPRAEGR